MKTRSVIWAVTLGVTAFFSSLQTHAQSLIYGLTTTNSLVVFSTNGAVVNGPGITGIGAGESVVAIDFRPFDGALYALTRDGSNVGRLYTVNLISGAATAISITGPTFAISGSIGMDFNPLANSGQNALRVVTGDRQNYRLTINGPLATLTVDLPLAPTNSPSGTNVIAAAYSNNRGGLPGAGGAGATTLYVLDSATDVLYVQNPPNNGTLVDAKPLGIDVGAVGGFDIDTLNDKAYAVLDTGTVGLYSINLATGTATLVRSLPNNIIDLAITLPVQNPPTLVYGLTATNSLVTFTTDSTNVSAALPITGISGGENVVAIDFRPLTGALYALTREPLNANLGRLYTVNLVTGVATEVPTSGATLLLTGSIAMDFNPAANNGQNALRIETGDESNYRITFAGTPASAVGDAPINNPGASGTNVMAAAYDHNYGGLPGMGGAGGTTLYVLDSDTDTLYVQNPPNNGTLTTPKPLALDIGSVGGLDIITGAGPIAPERAIAVLDVGGVKGLYSIDLVLGFANFIRDLPDTIVDLAAPIPGTMGPISNLPGTNVSAQLSGSIGPFTISRANNIIDPWCTVTTVASGPVTLPKDGPKAFYRVRDVAGGAPTRFTALLNGVADGSGASGYGFATAELNGNSFTYEVAYTGLSGTPTAAHLHSPAPTTGSASPLFNLAPVGGLGTTGRYAATVTLSAADQAAVLAGLAYFNIHTVTFGGGEIRGQIVPVSQKFVLTGVGERPNATTSPAFGAGALNIIGTNLTFYLTYQGLTAPATLAHFHGPADSAGTASPIIDIGTGAFGPLGSSSGTLTGKVVLTPTQLAAFADGKVYVNVHNANFPGGEIRGQVSPHIAERPFSAELTGAAERPTPVSSPGSGFIEGSLINDTFSFVLTYRGMTSSITAAHFHGPATSSVPAGILIDLQPFHRGPYAQQGVFRGCVALPPAEIAALLNGDLYVNLHTAVNPSGEIRGQLAPMVMTTSLNGPNERPTPNASPATAFGFVGLVGKEVSIGLHYRDLTGNINNSHYHGPADANISAPVLVGLPFKSGNPWGFIFDAQMLSDANAAIFSDNLIYVNIHSSTFPGGEIRGMVVP